MLRFFKYLLIVLVLLIGLGVALFIASVEDEPLVVATSATQVDDADSVKELIEQIKQSVRDRTLDQQIPLTENQLNSLVGFLQRAKAQFHGQANITPLASSLSASYQLPPNPVGRYVNFSALILPGQGLQLDEVRLGSIVLPGKQTLATLVWLADWWTNSTIASQFVQQIDSIRMFQGSMVIAMRPLDAFLRNLKDLKRDIGEETDLSLATAHYLRFLAELDVGQRPTAQSLARFIQPLFAEALSRSNQATAAEENEAAIMALATFAGHHRFASFIGDIQPKPKRVAVPRNMPTLMHRTDLSQHFIFSAAIKVLSEQGLTAAIGEFKELMDRGAGGSGYSFVDLAADHAGVKFALVATDEKTAFALQRLLSENASESSFFPDTSGLPENLNKSEFTKTFKQVDSPEYKRLLDEIDQRISLLPVSRLPPAR
ncbi:hypothetical protein Patl_0436 [Paraglaciecola sp. T6c]|uniref:hypothetical protein n=1 Tax=Pseudoalteromonas atlantica (strain T6c / ATCC BAA-1087) TaxID=3042615 RepID=UPI00005C6A53|nr:hypothetical protein [Paraglaciecola sp. T6c]ABG38966.1 hypothetical protein Patl_0436 [Paraglaciecola sp. T6c]